MKKTKDIHDPAGVDAYIRQLEPSFRALVEAVRQTILLTDVEIGQQIKWNAPSFFYTGTMAAFDAKDYKRDLVVMHLRKGFVLLIFPTGGVIEDVTGLLEGSYEDGRRMITIRNMEELSAKRNGLKTIIKSWLNGIED